MMDGCIGNEEARLDLILGTMRLLRIGLACYYRIILRDNGRAHGITSEPPSPYFAITDPH